LTTHALTDALVLVYLGLFVSTPVLCVSGLWRLRRCDRRMEELWRVSTVGFACTSLSFVLFAGMMAASLIGHQSDNAVGICVLGSALSGIGLVLAFLGVWSPGPLRWHALIVALGMFPFWFFGLVIASVGPMI